MLIIHEESIPSDFATVICLWDTVSRCSPCWSRTHYVDLVCLKLGGSQMLLPPMLALKAFGPMPNRYNVFECETIFLNWTMETYCGVSTTSLVAYTAACAYRVGNDNPFPTDNRKQVYLHQRNTFGQKKRIKDLVSSENMSSFSSKCRKQLVWNVHSIPALRRQWQVDLCDFKARTT